MTIEIGYWVIPLVITFVSFVVASMCAKEPSSHGYFPDFGAALLNIIRLAIALIVSLVAWLLWAIIN